MNVKNLSKTRNMTEVDLAYKVGSRKWVVPRSDCNVL